MKRRTTWGFAAGLILAATAAVSVPAHAAGFTGPCSTGIGKHAATTTLTNRPDGGGAGNVWALDGPNSRSNPTGKLTRTFVISQVSHVGSTWTWNGVICDGGTGQAIPGQLAPNQGAGHAGQTIGSAVNFTVNGTATYQFSTDEPLNTSSNLGVLTSEDGAPVTPQETTSLWFEQAFPASTAFTGAGIVAYSWTYQGAGQQWTDNNTTDGQAPGDGQIR